MNEMNCENCEYKNMKSPGDPHADQSHCYMFREEPTSTCGVFKLSRQSEHTIHKMVYNSKLPRGPIAKFIRDFNTL